MDDDIFIPIKVINNLRRELILELISLRKDRKKEIVFSDSFISSRENLITNEVSFLVRSEEQLRALIDKDVNIYVEDYSLYNKYKSDRVFYRNPRAGYSYKNSSNSLVSNNGGFVYYSGKSVSDIYMNVKNSLTLGLFSNFVYKVGLSPELDSCDIEKIISSYIDRFGCKPNVEVLVYGNLELMIMKYCPLRYLINNSNNCSLCTNRKFYLDSNGRKFRLLKDSIHNVRVMSNERIDKLSEISYLRSIGVTNFRIDLLDENACEVLEILHKLDLN